MIDKENEMFSEKELQYEKMLLSMRDVHNWDYEYIDFISRASVNGKTVRIFLKNYGKTYIEEVIYNRYWP